MFQCFGAVAGCYMCPFYVTVSQQCFNYKKKSGITWKEKQLMRRLRRVVTRNAFKLKVVILIFVPFCEKYALKTRFVNFYLHLVIFMVY